MKRLLAALVLLAVDTAGVAAQPRARLASQADSLRHLPNYGVTDTTRVVSTPVTLREIIARAVVGEKTKLGGHDDMTYTMTVRTISQWKKRKEIFDAVFRVYTERGGFSRFVKLNDRVEHFDLKEGEWRLDPEETERSSGVRFESDDSGDFVEIPFFLEEQHEFDFELLDRIIEVDHVIFKIGFRPKSSFKPLPSGVVYVDTNDYRIIHEEFRFERNPFPLLLKNVRNVTRQWEQLPGGEWVFTHVLAEIELRGGFLGRIPDKVQVAVSRDHFEFDRGYDANRFGER